MPPASRISDIDTGHDCFPPTNIIQGSPNVITCSMGQARLSDALVPHGCPRVPPHSKMISKGSSTVITNSLPSARISDSIACGGMIATGCGTVIMGG